MLTVGPDQVCQALKSTQEHTSGATYPDQKEERERFLLKPTVIVKAHTGCP